MLSRVELPPSVLLAGACLGKKAINWLFLYDNIMHDEHGPD
jgi:hypothetical protein